MSGVVPAVPAANEVDISPGLLHGARSYLLDDNEVQILAARPISAGLDHRGVGPKQRWLKEMGRVKYY